MRENKQENALLEILEEINPETQTQDHENIKRREDEHKFDFLVHDMFFDHFFP